MRLSSWQDISSVSSEHFLRQHVVSFVKLAMDSREGSPTPPGPHGPQGQGLVNNEIMSQLDQLISSKWACLEDRMTSTQKSIADSQLSKMKEDMLSNNNYDFKRKSCEDQFKFQCEVIIKTSRCRRCR